MAKSAPDPVEGLWEIGNEFMAIDLDAVLNDKDTGYRFVMWLRSTRDLAPQAAASLLLLLTSRLELRQSQVARANRSLSRSDSVPWTTRELAEWLDADLPKKPVDVPSIICHYPLWR